jgi:adenosylcobinamide-GDP ribazoletransferase
MPNVMSKVMLAVRHYLLALQFFTRIPVTGGLAEWVGFSPAMLRASAGHFPGVGILVGVIVAGFSAVLLATLPNSSMLPLVVAVLGTLLSVMLTGAFHEDGLADIADGLGGSYERERALIIMKDSRVGAFGALALVLAIFSKVALLALIGSISLSAMLLALFTAHVVSRGWPLLLVRLMAHVGDAAGSKSKPLADKITSWGLLTALLWVLVGLAMAFVQQSFTAGFYLWNFLLTMAAALLASGLGFLYMWRLLWRRLQGFTGDGLGATQQVCEIAFYFGLALAL